MPKFIDITGQKFGRLTVLKKTIERKNGGVIWLCKCECGSELNTRADSLKEGRTKSCGCLQREKVTKHGLSKTNFYQVFKAIEGRCSNKNNQKYKYYGKKGIKCLWETFEEFKNDMYNSYLIHKKDNSYTSIDRINNDGNYNKKNCRWANHYEQNRNRSINVFLTYNGKTKTHSEWSKELNINRTFLWRYIKKGFSLEEIIKLKNIC